MVFKNGVIHIQAMGYKVRTYRILVNAHAYQAESSGDVYGYEMDDYYALL